MFEWRGTGATAVFDLVRKLFGPDELLSAIQRDYGMQHVVADAPVISGSAVPRWWLGRCGSVPFAIRPSCGWTVHVGHILTVGDLLLHRVGSKRSPNAALRIEDHLPAGHALGLNFFIVGSFHMDERFHGGQLTRREIADPLGELSEAAIEIQLYRTGVDVKFDRRKLDRARFDADLLRASRVAEGLERFARDLDALPSH